MKNYQCPPVLFVVFNRPENTEQVFEKIREACPKQLFVAADGPRDTHENDEALCSQVREIATRVDWECEVTTKFSEQNLGCKVAVSSAITWFFENVEEGIIFEDDCVPDLSFFWFCAEMLEQYRTDDTVMQISGNNFLPTGFITDGSYYFSKHGDIWGWATWRRAWKHFDLSMPGFDEFKGSGRIYDFLPNKDFAKWQMSYFEETQNVNVSVWSSQWTYAKACKNGTTIAPAENLVKNNGFSGGPATHGLDKSFNLYDGFPAKKLTEIVEPSQNQVNQSADDARFEVIRRTDPRLRPLNKARRFVRKILPEPVVNILRRVRRGR